MILVKPFASSGTFIAIVRAGTREELFSRVHEASQLASGAALRLPSMVERETADSASHGECCVTIVADSLSDLAAKLQRAGRQLADGKRARINDRTGIYFHDQPLGERGKVAVLFPGEGSQYENALTDLAPEFPEISEMITPPAGEARAMWDMIPAIRRVLSADLALFHVLRGLGLEPDVVAGHSTGETAALIVAQMIPGESAADLHRLLDGLGTVVTPSVIRDIGKATLIAAGTDRSTAESLLAGIQPPMQVAMYNCPHQTVIVGDEASAAIAIERMLEQGIMYEVLLFDRPYHTELCAPLAVALREPYERSILNPPSIPLYSCTAGRRFPSDVEAARKMALDQWTSRVEFPDMVEAMYADGARIFVESGPRGNLSAFVSDILRGRPHAAIPANIAQRSGIDQLVHLIAQLTAHGVRLGTVNQTVTNDRAPVIAAHLEFMERFYSVQQRVMLAYLEKRGMSESLPLRKKSQPADVASASHILPLIGTILSYLPGEEVVAIRDFNVDDDLFLAHHTFGRNVSDIDPSLTGLPIMPLTMSIEMMVEGASLLCPDLSLLSVEHIRALRWATSESGRFTLRVEARRSLESPDCIDVALLEHESGTHNAPLSRLLVAEATVRFGDRPSQVVPPRMYKGVASPIQMGRDAIFREIMFHGPLFQGTVSLDAIARDGAEATVEVLPRERLLLSNPNPRFLTDPVLLDQAGQVVAYWMSEYGRVFPMEFPLRIGSIECYAPPLQAGAMVRCVLSKAALSDSDVTGDIDVLTSTGEVYARLTGWESRRFEVPAFYIQHSYSPRELLFCERWPEAEQLAAAASAGDAQVFRIAMHSFPDGFFDASGGVWQKSLALTILSRREREVWRALKTPPPRRLEWLLGRSAAKDAVRSYVKEHFGIVLPPADIEIETDSSRRPRVSGGWIDRVPFGLHLSIAHSAGTAVAIVAGDCCDGIGIDLEHVSRLNDDVVAAGFAEAERRLLEVSGSEGVEWGLRLWCAKEAAAKAVGHGFRHQPRSLTGEAVSSEGVIDIVADVEQASNGPSALPAVIRVHTAFDGEFALAICPLVFSKQQGMYERSEQLA